MSGEAPLEEVYVPGTRPRPDKLLPYLDDLRPGTGPVPNSWPIMPANEPLPPPANDELPIEEVKVTGKNLKRLLSLLRWGLRGWPGFDSTMSNEELLRLYQLGVNLQTEQDLETQEELDENLDPDVLDESTENELNRRPGQFKPGLGDFGFSAQDAAELQKLIKLLRLEEVVVTAKRIKHGTQSTLVVPWNTAELFFNHYWTNPSAFPIDPGYRPFPESPPEVAPEIAPLRPPRQNPTTDPDRSTLQTPAGSPYVSGNIALTLDPNIGLQLKIARKPDQARYEENIPRRDRKYGKAVRLYRSLLRVHTTTFGTYTEILDFMDVLMNNLTVDGKYLWKYDNPYQMLLYAIRTGNWDINWQAFAMDYAANQAQDFYIGFAAGSARQALNEMGYWGPNPGSYLPDPP